MKQVLVSAAITRDSVENKAKQYCISPQTVRNYVEQTVIDKIMERIKKPSIKNLIKKTQTNKNFNRVDFNRIRW